VIRKLVALLTAAAVVTGCGGGGDGTASLWVTRDRGADVVLVREVPAGLTVLQALDREAEIATRYGGRFVQAINGIEGSLAARRDRFYFVNGYEADRGGAEYRLHDGDVAWWDFRSWEGGAEREPVVVGAFPEPFLHGYGGKKRPAAVRYAEPGMRGTAEAIAELIGAGSTEPMSVPPPGGANVLELVADPGRLTASGEGPGQPVRFVVDAEVARRLAIKPDLARFRFEGAG
jgi:uncharacterized protein DUF4430